MLYVPARCSWCQIAASLPGRTDNDIKNYWNSFIKKKKLKHTLDSLSTNKNTKCDIASDCDPTCNSKSVSGQPPARDVFTSFHLAPQQLDAAMDEGYKLHDSTFNGVTNAESQSWIDCIPSHDHECLSANAFASPRLEEQGQAYKTEESAYRQIINSWSSTQTQLPREADSSSGISSSAWSTRNPYSIAAVCTPGAYTASDLRGISNLENYKSLHENSTLHQACPPLNSCSQLSGPAIMWTDVDQYRNDEAQVQVQHDYNDRVNLKQISYQVSHIGGLQVGYQQDCSTLPSDGPLEFECEGEAGQEATLCAQYDDPVYNILADTTACSHLYQTYFTASL